MTFIPDEQEKTVKIPIQVRTGEIRFYFDGVQIGLLPQTTVGSLVSPRSCAT
jgi:hypothetical protein